MDNVKLPQFKKIGVNVQIMTPYTFGNPENISIGDNVYIGPESYIWGSGGLTIKSGTIIGPRVTIMTTNHHYDGEDLLSIPYDHVAVHRPVEIGENVWIGANVILVPGIRVGEGSVISMGSVVCKDVPKYAVVGGNPARVLKYRNAEIYEKLKRENKIYLSLKSKGYFSQIDIEKGEKK